MKRSTPPPLFCSNCGGRLDNKGQAEFACELCGQTFEILDAVALDYWNGEEVEE